MTVTAKGWRRYLDAEVNCDDCGGSTRVACLIGNAEDNTLVCPRCIRRYAASTPPEQEAANGS